MLYFVYGCSEKVHLNSKISRTPENQPCIKPFTRSSEEGDLAEWFILLKFILMKLINKTLPDGQIKPIPHIPDDPGRIGTVMTETELHEFGLTLLIAYLDIKDADVVQPTGSLISENSHMIVKAPNNQMFDFWVKTVMCPQVPTIDLFKHHEDIICLASQINAIPVFAGLMLTCLSHEDPGMPIIGGSYKAEFTGLKQFQ